MELNPRQFAGRSWQPHLFIEPRQDPVPRPGDLSNAQWHGTDREGWSDEIRSTGTPIHSGTLAAAHDRGTTAFYPVWPQRPLHNNALDEDANAAHARYSEERGIHVSSSVLESANFDASGNEMVDELVEALEGGYSIPYDNTGEDIGSISYVSPPGGYRTIRDTDLGLAKNTGWTPREYLTKSEVIAQFGSFGAPLQKYAYERIDKDPRLFEEVHNEASKKAYPSREEMAQAAGPYYRPEDLDAFAARGPTLGGWGTKKVNPRDVKEGAKPL